MSRTKDTLTTIRDIPYDIMGEVLSRLSPHMAMKVGMADAELYRHYKKEFVKLREYYENVPQPEEIDQLLDRMVEEAKVSISFSLVSTDDIMEEDFLSPSLNVTWGELSAIIRFYEDGTEDPRMLEVRVIRRQSQVFQLIAVVTIYKPREVAPYRIFIEGGNQNRIDRNVLTASTMMIHRLRQLSAKATVPRNRRALFDRVLNHAVERVASVYSKNMRTLIVQPAVSTQQSPYPLSMNVRRRTSPKQNW